MVTVVHFLFNHSNLVLTPFRYLIHNHINTNLYFTLNPLDSVVKEKSHDIKPKHQEARGRCLGVCSSINVQGLEDRLQCASQPDGKSLRSDPFQCLMISKLEILEYLRKCKKTSLSGVNILMHVVVHEHLF